jgi:hypothetical protein
MRTSTYRSTFLYGLYWPVVVDSHHCYEEQDPNLLFSKNSDPDQSFSNLFTGSFALQIARWPQYTCYPGLRIHST